MTPPHLLEADRAEVTVLVDNYADFLVPKATPVDRRPPMDPHRPLLAEHGLSLLVRVAARGKEHAILMDAGLSEIALLHNIRHLGCRPEGVEAVVLSHGHFDHTGGLCGFLRLAPHQLPVVLHPDAFLARRLKVPGGASRELPAPDAVTLKQAGADIMLREGPSGLAAGHLLVTGEVPRITPFEKGLPGAEALRDGSWVPDSIRDDQGLVIQLRGKGLVVISGCAHAGIVNTVRYAQELTGTERVHAVMGGFHLAGPAFAPVIGPTAEALRAIGPDYLVPMHCTGREAMARLAEALPGRCLLNTVGTTYSF